MNTGIVWAVCISDQKGTIKHDIGEALLLARGDCIMPKKGILCSVIKGDMVKKGDTVRKISDK